MIHHRENVFRLQRTSVLTIAGLVSVFALASAIFAGANTNANSKPAEVPARVIAHLALTAPAGNQMVLQKLGDKRYLYIQQASKQGYMIVDVTKAEFPSIVKPKGGPNDSTAGNLEFVDGKMAIAATPDSTSKTAIRSVPTATQTVKLLDVSDPAHPTVLQTFKNVTAMLGDGGRGIIFLVNDEGLWVLKHNRQLLVPEAHKKPCDSYTAIQAMPPDCQ